MGSASAPGTTVFIPSAGSARVISTAVAAAAETTGWARTRSRIQPHALLALRPLQAVKERHSHLVDPVAEPREECRQDHERAEHGDRDHQDRRHREAGRTSCRL